MLLPHRFQYATRHGLRRHAQGLTLVELLIASAISSMVGIGLVGLAIMTGRLDKSISRQQLCMHEAQTAIEGINAQIRLATTPLRIVDANGKTATQGNRVEFKCIGDAKDWSRSIELISADNDLMTPWDNRLMYDPDTGADGDEVEFAHWVAPIDPAGAFSNTGAQKPLEVHLRAGDPANAKQNYLFTSGPGRQGVEVNIAVAPRN